MKSQAAENQKDGGCDGPDGNANEAEHHEHMARPKIPKGKLPSVFIPSRKKKEDKGHVGPELSEEQQNDGRQVSTEKPERKKPNVVERKDIQGRKSKKSMNPLIPARNQFKLFDQLESVISEARQDFERFAKMNIDRLGNPTITYRLDQTTTVAIVSKNSTRNSVIKKVLNVPNCKLLYLQQIPISSKDSANHVKEALQAWQSYPSNTYQLRTHGLFWNSPEGFLTLLYDYQKAINLTQLIDIVDSLPAYALKSLASDFISALELLQKHDKYEFLSDIGEVFLSSSTSKLILRPQIELNATHHADDTLSSLLAVQNGGNDKQKNAILRIGLILFHLSIGQFCYEQQVVSAIEYITKNYAAIVKTFGKKACCIMHIIDLCSSGSQLIGNMIVPLYKTARKKFTKNQQDFLCGCLHFNVQIRMRVDEASSHSFLGDWTGKIDIKDMMRIVTSQVKKNEQLLQNLIGAIEMILQSCGLFTPPNLVEDHPVVQALSSETGITTQQISRRLIQAYTRS